MGRTYVCNGARLACSMGSSVSNLIVLPDRKILLDGQPQANIMDHLPLTNIMPFGMCSSMANPIVASATAANSGVLTPQPCIPNTTSPWMNGENKLLLKNYPALCQDCTLQCGYLGSISIIHNGQGMGQGAFPLSKEDASGELLNKTFFTWDSKSVEVGGEIQLKVKTLDRNKTSASFKMLDADTDEVLKEFTVQLSEGEGKSESFKVPREWATKTIKTIES